jgi:hypothetical protein
LTALLDVRKHKALLRRARRPKPQRYLENRNCPRSLRHPLDKLRSFIDDNNVKPNVPGVEIDEVRDVHNVIIKK